MASFKVMQFIRMISLFFPFFISLPRSRPFVLFSLNCQTFVWFFPHTVTKQTIVKKFIYSWEKMSYWWRNEMGKRWNLFGLEWGNYFVKEKNKTERDKRQASWSTKIVAENDIIIGTVCIFLGVFSSTWRLPFNRHFFFLFVVSFRGRDRERKREIKEKKFYERKKIIYCLTG